MEQTRGLFCTCDSGVARNQSQRQWPTSIELKFKLKSLRNRCARAFTPERLQLELLVGWQVNKKKGPECSTSILHRRQKGCYKLHSLLISRTKNDAQLSLFCKNKSFGGN